MIDEAVQQLLDGFVASVRQVAAIEAVWLHGSLALGDYQLGRTTWMSWRWSRRVRRPPSRTCIGG